MDLFTTLVELAQEEIPQDRFIDGKICKIIPSTCMKFFNSLFFVNIFINTYLQVQIYELTWDWCHHPDKPIIKWRIGASFITAAISSWP